MIKILYIFPVLKKSGPTNQLINIIDGLDREEFDPYVLALKDCSDEEVVGRLENSNVSVDSMQLSSYFDLFRSIFRIINIINRYDVDIVHSTQLFPDMLTLFLRRHKRVITIRGDIPALYASKYGSLSYMVGLIHVFLISKAKDISLISCSESTKDILFKKYNVTSRLIANGVDQKVYFPLPGNEKKELKAALGFSLGKDIYVSSGSLDNRKDMDTVVKGWLMSEAITSSILLILGEGPNYDELKIKYKDCSDVHIIGYVDNIIQYLQVSDYFISASYSEGLPNSVLEAMSCGLITILSDIMPHREIVSDHDDVKFFSPGDYRYLSLCINYVRHQNYFKLSNKIRYNVDLKFTAKKMSLQYQSLYADMYYS